MSNFSDSRNILNKKPRIQFVEPAQIPGPQAPIATPVPTIEETKTRLTTIVSQYNRLEKLADIAQERIDKRAQDMRVCLDPVVDADIIMSLRRHFKTNDNCITYAQYKHCLQELAKAGQEATPFVTADNINKAAQDPLKTDISGSGKPNGGLRPDLNIPSPVKPVDLDSFQKESINKLFQMMFPLLTALNDAKIQQHLITAKHG